MSRTVALGSILLALILAGCFRTHYINLDPPGTDSPGTVATRSSISGWQHFFIWGWVPRERVIEAEKVCGPGAHVQEIRTQQTFLEGLVQQLASYYINIYSPYDAEVFCAPTATVPVAKLELGH